MSGVKLQSQVEKQGVRILRLAEKIPRFRRSRQATALIDSIRYGESDLAIWLLHHGVEANSADNKRRTALWWAATYCRTDVICELLKRNAALPDDVLIGPVHDGDKKAVRILLQRGANLDCVGSIYSPVGHHHIKQVLLTIALGTAARDPKLEAIPIMLVRAGARINRLILPTPASGLENRTMLGMAAYFGLLKTVAAMIAVGVDVNLRDFAGRTALFDAVCQGHFAVAKALLRAKAKTDIRDHAGLTPLESLQRGQIPELKAALCRITAADDIAQKRLDEWWQQTRTRLVALLERHLRGNK